jgi:hypothetical protein
MAWGMLMCHQCGENPLPCKGAVPAPNHPDGMIGQGRDYALACQERTGMQHSWALENSR